MPEEPLVQPAYMLAHRGLKPGQRAFAAAVLCFRNWENSRRALRRLGARPVRRRYLSFVQGAEGPSGLWSCRIAGQRVAVLPHLVWGGPSVAVVVEELAALGVRWALGFGASGALREDLWPGTIVGAERALVSCGTSREYTRERVVGADPELLQLARKLATEAGVTIRWGTAWTTDTLYRELPSRVRAWRRRGADWLNMETASFYAVAAHTGVRALHLGPISDVLAGQSWDTWYRDLTGPDEVTVRLCRRVLERVLEPGSPGQG